MTKKHQLDPAFALAILAAFCGGSVPVAAKVALEVVQPFTLVFIRFFLATLFLLPFVIKTNEVNFNNLKKFIPVGLIGALNPILLFIALPFTQASVSPLIYASVPAMTAVYMFLFKQFKLSRKQIFGILIGFIGVGLIVLLPVLQKGTPVSALKGNLLIFGAAIAFLAYSLISKQNIEKFNASPLVLTFYFCLVTLILSLPLAGVEVMTNGITLPIGLKHVFSGVFVGIVGTGVFYLVYQYALKAGTTLAAALFTYLQPIATILMAVMFLGEAISLPFIVGGVLAVLGARVAASK